MSLSLAFDFSHLRLCAYGLAPGNNHRSFSLFIPNLFITFQSFWDLYVILCHTLILFQLGNCTLCTANGNINSYKINLQIMIIMLTDRKYLNRFERCHATMNLLSVREQTNALINDEISGSNFRNYGPEWNVTCYHGTRNKYHRHNVQKYINKLCWYVCMVRIGIVHVIICMWWPCFDIYKVIFCAT